AVVLAVQVSPVALSFRTEHRPSSLPAVTDLAAGDHAAGRVIAITQGKPTARGKEFPALVGHRTADVAADIEARPVELRTDDRGLGGSLGVDGRCRHRHRAVAIQPIVQTNLDLADGGLAVEQRLSVNRELGLLAELGVSVLTLGRPVPAEVELCAE